MDLVLPQPAVRAGRPSGQLWAVFRPAKGAVPTPRFQVQTRDPHLDPAWEGAWLPLPTRGPQYLETYLDYSSVTLTQADTGNSRSVPPAMLMSSWTSLLRR